MTFSRGKCQLFDVFISAVRKSTLGMHLMQSNEWPKCSLPMIDLVSIHFINFSTVAPPGVVLFLLCIATGGRLKGNLPITICHASNLSHYSMEFLGVLSSTIHNEKKSCRPLFFKKNQPFFKARLLNFYYVMYYYNRRRIC